jgi:RNA recognition motif-containing protein
MVDKQPHTQTDHKLFVGNMPSDVREDEIQNVFSRFGEIVEIHLMSGARSRSGQSSAFVRLMTQEACFAAIESLNMKGRIRPTDPDALSVKFAKPTASVQASNAVSSTSSFICLDGSSTAASTPSTTPLASPTSFSGSTSTVKLFVGGLPSYVDRDDLIAIFTPFGKVESVHLMKNNKSKSGQSCAFINFHQRTEAQAAIHSLAGKYYVDVDLPPITVRLADTEDHSKRVRIGSMSTNSNVEEVAKRLAEQAACEILLANII